MAFIIGAVPTAVSGIIHDSMQLKLFNFRWHCSGVQKDVGKGATFATPCGRQSFTHFHHTMPALVAHDGRQMDQTSDDIDEGEL